MFLVSAITQGSYIRYYTAVWYDTAALKEHRSRSRRDASTSGYPGDATLNLRLHALDRFVKKNSSHPPSSCSYDSTLYRAPSAERKKSRRGNAVNGGVGRREGVESQGWELYRRKILVSRGCQRRNNLWMSGHFNWTG